MRLRADRVTVSVPATTSDFGPAFDSLGMALKRADVATIRAVAGPSQVRIVNADIAGRAESWLDAPNVESHLTVRALRLVLDHVGAPQVGVSLTYSQSIPAGSGLGEREAQVLAGLYGAWTLLGKPAGLDEAVMLELATAFRVSAVRVRAATNGGLALAFPRLAVDADSRGAEAGRQPAGPGRSGASQASSAIPGGRVVDTAGPPLDFLGAKVRPEVRPIALVPGFAVPEEDAAAILPRAVSFRRYAANAARATALVPLLATGWDQGNEGESEERLSRWRAMVLAATVDDVVQLHREVVAPASIALIRWLRQRGIAAFLSGGGPTVLCLWPPSSAELSSVKRAGWRVLDVGVDTTGLTLDV